MSTITRRETEDKLSGALAQARVLHSIIVQQAKDYIETWTTVRGTALSDVAEVANLTWGDGRTYKLKNANLGSFRTNDVVKICKTLVRISPSAVWYSNEHLLDNGVDLNARDIWAEMLMMATEIVRISKEHDGAQRDVEILRRDLWANDIRFLRGYYVKVENKRRIMYGWIDKGRGKSVVHITADPLVQTTFGFSDLRPEDVAGKVITAASNGITDLGKEDKMSWTPQTSVEVLLPPEDAKMRREAVASALSIGRTTYLEAIKVSRAVRDWRSAHEALVRRRDQVKGIDDQFADFDPFKAEHIISNTMKVWVTEANRAYGKEINEIVRTKMLADIGGPLTVSEEDILSTEPDGSYDTQVAWQSMIAEQIDTSTLWMLSL